MRFKRLYSPLRARAVIAMLMLFSLSALGVASSTQNSSESVGSGGAVDLTVERLRNPIGIDVPSPRLGWRLPVGTRKQSAYEIESGGETTGKIESSRQIDVPWPFARPHTSQRIAWRVRIWDETGHDLGWSAYATFVAGIMRPEDWHSKWIAQNPLSRQDVDLGLARWTRCEKLDLSFLCGNTSERSDLVFAATSVARVEINGEIFYVPNGGTYDHRIPFFLNLTGRLKVGENVISIVFDDAIANKWESPRTSVPEHVVIAMVRFPSGRRVWSTAEGDGRVDLGSQYEPDFAKEVDWREETHSPAFEREFEVRKEIRSATLHICGLGFYEAKINGRRIGDKVLDPVPTDYDDRVMYSTYILDDMVFRGTNRLSVALGHGWWDVRSYTGWNLWRAPWRSCPCVIAQLELEYEDGSRDEIGTDDSWMEIPSAVWWDCLKEGVVIGSPRQIADGLHVAEVMGPRGKLVAEDIPATRVVREIRPCGVQETVDGEYVVRFPETISGWARVRFHDLAKGDWVRISYEENLTPNGGRPMPRRENPTWKWTDWDRLIDVFFYHTGSYHWTGAQGGFQTDHYFATGSGDEVYEPKFSYNGFNAVILSGLRHIPRLDDVVGKFAQTDFRAIGEFESSDATLNALVEMAKNSYRVNFTNGFPTDCPHREKLGWTGDAWIASDLGMMFFENVASYRKWLKDLIDAQRDDGAICSIAPTSGWGFRDYSGPVFDAAIAVIPWNLYRYWGDRGALELAYPALRRYLEFERKMKNEKGLVSNGLGDWNAPEREKMPSNEYVASCAYLYILKLSSQIAALLGRDGDRKQDESDALDIRRSLVSAYYDGNGRFDNGGQTAQALAVLLELSPTQDRTATADLLVQSCLRPIEFGLVGAKVVYRALTKVGRDDLALKMIIRKERPAPGYWVGKTSTLWEDFGLGFSKAHVMLGDFAAWAMECLAGIHIETCDAYRLRPSTTSGLERAGACTETPFGRLAFFWVRKADGHYAVKADIPPGATARLELPGMKAKMLTSGQYEF